MNKMDDVTRAKLAGLLPATSTFLVSYVPKSLEVIEEQYRPVFSLRPFNQGECKEIAKFLEKNPNNETYITTKIRKQIIDVSNLVDISTDTVLDFMKDNDSGMAKDQWDMLPTVVQVDIVQEILRISGMRS